MYLFILERNLTFSGRLFLPGGLKSSSAGILEDAWAGGGGLTGGLTGGLGLWILIRLEIRQSDIIKNTPAHNL